MDLQQVRDLNQKRVNKVKVKQSKHPYVLLNPSRFSAEADTAIIQPTEVISG